MTTNKRMTKEEAATVLHEMRQNIQATGQQHDIMKRAVDLAIRSMKADKTEDEDAE